MRSMRPNRRPQRHFLVAIAAAWALAGHAVHDQVADAASRSSIALSRLDFDSELACVGDAGAAEANRPSTSHGIEWSNRYTPLPWLLVDADLAWTHARFSDADPVGSCIPNAVDKVALLALTARDLGPWSTSIQWRYLGSGALTEDDSVRPKSSPTTNLRISRKLTPKPELTLDAFNLLNRKVNESRPWLQKANCTPAARLRPGSGTSARKLPTVLALKASFVGAPLSWQSTQSCTRVLT